MILEKLQNDLEEIYRLDRLPRVDEFLISTGEIKELLSQAADPMPQVLFQQDHEEVFLAVHIGDERLQKLQGGGIGELELKDFCSVTEELSHFTYLIWRSKNELPVSLLDVELQGEIDKFLLSMKYYADSCEELFSQMFEKIRFKKQGDHETEERYRKANQLGAKFCRALLSGMDEGAGKEVFDELRSFYREASQQRILKIDRL